MVVSWTPHRFSGGALALDVTNTVVLRGDARGFDRFADASEIPRFAAVATRERAAELDGTVLTVGVVDRIAPLVLSIRETTDRLFRTQALDGAMDSTHLAPFLTACAEGVAGPPVRLGGRRLRGPSSPVRFEAALAVSALSLLPPERSARIRICANCDWLFVDESRNRSRIWCDMNVCGNRRKAKRHYDRHKEKQEAIDA